MSPSLFVPLLEKLKGARSVSILGHVRPDGDAYGSTLGLGLSLREAGKEVFFFNQEGMSPAYAFLPGSDQLQATPAEAPACDLVISVDTSVENRLGPAFMGWNRKVDLNIDHHVSNTNYGILNLVDPSLPATAALLLRIIQAGGLPLPPFTAANLFVGLSTDTGSFRYRGTTADTFQAAADLVRAGADSAELSRQCYQSVTPQKFELTRLALQTIRFEKDSRLGVMELTPEMFQASGASSADTEGLIDFLQDIQSVSLAALFEFRDSNTLKVSLRSKGEINVSQLASEFGGGGHPAAAGINLQGNVREMQNKILDRLRQAL